MIIDVKIRSEKKYIHGTVIGFCELDFSIKQLNKSHMFIRKYVEDILLNQGLLTNNSINIIYEDIGALMYDFSYFMPINAMARITGINESQMRQYAIGIRVPSVKTKQKLISNLSDFADKIKSINISGI